MKDSNELGPVNHRVELTLPNELGYERVAMDCSASFARIHGFPGERVEDLKTVVAEAVANAIQHGNRGRPESRVTVRIEVVGDTIYATVADEGGGLSGAVPEPDIEQLIDTQTPAAGFGLFLMRKLADRIEFKRLSGGGHEVRMGIRSRTGAGARVGETATAAGPQR